jgi:hypothetical protein
MSASQEIAAASDSIDMSVTLPNGKRARFCESKGPNRDEAVYSVGKPFMTEMDGKDGSAVRVNCAQFSQRGETYLRYVNMSGDMNIVWLQLTTAEARHEAVR